MLLFDVAKMTRTNYLCTYVSDCSNNGHGLSESWSSVMDCNWPDTHKRLNKTLIVGSRPLSYNINWVNTVKILGPINWVVTSSIVIWHSAYIPPLYRYSVKATLIDVVKISNDQCT